MNSKKIDPANENPKPSRRKFFIGAGVTVGAAAIASQTPLGQAIVKDVADAVTDKPEGYHLTAHIKKYYQTTLV
jgi:hypothetical protein